MELEWTTNLESKISSSCFAYQMGHRLLLFISTTAGHLHVLDGTSGEQVAAIHLTGELFASPVVIPTTLSFPPKDNDAAYVILGSRDDQAYCIRITTEHRQQR